MCRTSTGRHASHICCRITGPGAVRSAVVISSKSVVTASVPACVRWSARACRCSRCRSLSRSMRGSRVAVNDRPCRNAGYFVGMLALGPGDDGGYPAAAGVQRYPALGPLVHLAPPSVDRPDRGVVVGAGGQAVLDQGPREHVEPVRVRRGDHDLAQLTH